MNRIWRGCRGRALMAAAVILAALAPRPAAGEKASGWISWEKARARLSFRVAGELYDKTPDSERRFERIGAERAKLRSALGNLATSGSGERPVLERGLREEAYVSALDDSAQPFLRYLPESSAAVSGRPLLLYLHGYSPELTLFNWQVFSPALTNIAERLDCALAMPFGRSNTDFQGIGEQDVLRVIDEMHRRYAVNTNKVILIGYSMGGMGAWTLGARFAERFAGLMMISARGDYYAWHRIDPESLPDWRRRLVDDAFAPRYLDRLANMPVLLFHGQADPLIPLREALAIYKQAIVHNPEVKLRVLKDQSHWIDDLVLRSATARDWLRECLAEPPDPARSPVALGMRPGQTPSRLQNAFLSPFMFVAPAQEPGFRSRARLMERAGEWRRYAKAWPRMKNERDLLPGDVEAFNLFVFGEPENSPLVREALRLAGAEWDSEIFLLADRAIPRRDHGLWLAVPSPRSSGRTLVVQCGLPWGPNLPDNHRYDMLPDVMAFSGIEDDRNGFPEVHSAGYTDATGNIEWW